MSPLPLYWRFCHWFNIHYVILHTRYINAWLLLLFTIAIITALMLLAVVCYRIGHLLRHMVANMVTALHLPRINFSVASGAMSYITPPYCYHMPDEGRYYVCCILHYASLPFTLTLRRRHYCLSAYFILTLRDICLLLLLVFRYCLLSLIRHYAAPYLLSPVICCRHAILFTHTYALLPYYYYFHLLLLHCFHCHAIITHMPYYFHAIHYLRHWS